MAAGAISAPSAVASALAAFAEENFTQAATHFTTALDGASGQERAALLCNRAACYAAVSMHRKCVADCVASQAESAHYLTAYVLQGKALAAQRKPKAARKAWQAGVAAAAASPLADATTYATLLQLLRTLPAKGGKPAAPRGAAAAPTPAPAPAPTAAPPPKAAPAPAPKAAPKPTRKAARAASGAGGGGGASQAAMMEVVAVVTAGNELVNAGRNAEAIATFNKLLPHRAPGVVELWLGRGSAKAMAGDLQGALADFDAAVRVDGGRVDAHKRRGQVLQALGRAPEALAAMQRAAELMAGGKGGKGGKEAKGGATGKGTAAGVKDAAAEAHLLLQKGQALFANKEFEAAAADFTAATELAPGSAEAWEGLGQALATVGRCEAAFPAFAKAVALAPGEPGPLVHWAGAAKAWGDGEGAREKYDLALRVAPGHRGALSLRGMLLHAQGRPRAAAGDLQAALDSTPAGEPRADAAFMAATVLHALGRWSEAVPLYDAVVAEDGAHMAFAQRDWAVHQARWADERLFAALPAVGVAAAPCPGAGAGAGYSPDARVPGAWKEGYTKRLGRDTWGSVAHLAGAPHKPEAASGMARDVGAGDAAAPPEWTAAWAPVAAALAAEGGVNGPAAGEADPVAALLATADALGASLQYEGSPGFLRNGRQHRQFGCAAIHVAQVARAHWAAPGGLAVPDTASSSAQHEGGAGSHPLSWRDVVDIPVAWRQMSEPFDPVWYLDRLTPVGFREGFGLQTPMFSGQQRIPRYWPYCARALAAAKALLARSWPLTPAQRDALGAARDVGAAFAAVGREFFVLTPCYSEALPPPMPPAAAGTLAPEVWVGGLEAGDDAAAAAAVAGAATAAYGVAALPPTGDLPDALPEAEAGRVHCGTRLTLRRKAGMPGHEFTIRTPGTPQRWAALEGEMEAAWAALCALMAAPPGERDARAIARQVLALYFFFVNMGPLTRGSSAVGLALLTGLALATGLPLSLPMTGGVQLDWEGILSPTLSVFAARTVPAVFRPLWSRLRAAAREGDAALAAAATAPLPAAPPTCAGAVDVARLPQVCGLLGSVRRVIAAMAGAEA